MQIFYKSFPSKIFKSRRKGFNVSNVVSVLVEKHAQMCGYIRSDSVFWIEICIFAPVIPGLLIGPGISSD